MTVALTKDAKDHFQLTGFSNVIEAKLVRGDDRDIPCGTLHFIDLKGINGLSRYVPTEPYAYIEFIDNNVKEGSVLDKFS